MRASGSVAGSSRRPRTGPAASGAHLRRTTYRVHVSFTVTDSHGTPRIPLATRSQGPLTGIETRVLAIRVRSVRAEPTVTTAVATGLWVLAVGSIVEHVLTVVAVTGVDPDVPPGAVVVCSVSGTILWRIRLEILERVGVVVGFGVAIAVLAVLLVSRHAPEDTVLRGRDLCGDRIHLDTVGFSLVEAAGATASLALVLRPGLVGGAVAGVDAAVVGLAVIAGALFVEHTIGVRFSTR